MPKVDVYDIKGKKVSDTEQSDKNKTKEKFRIRHLEILSAMNMRSKRILWKKKSI